MGGVAQQFPHLIQRVVQLAAAPENRSTPELDLAGLTELDACGCQLLASFVRTLRQQGFIPFCKGISDDLHAKIRFLGFEHELGLSGGLSRECP